MNSNCFIELLNKAIDGNANGIYGVPMAVVTKHYLDSTCYNYSVTRDRKGEPLQNTFFVSLPLFDGATIKVLITTSMSKAVTIQLPEYGVKMITTNMLPSEYERELPKTLFFIQDMYSSGRDHVS